MVRILGISLLVVAGTVPAHAQPPAPKPSEATVGANDIFQALTEPGRAARIEALRTLRDALAHHPDPAMLESAREKLDSLLQSEQQTESTMPPALVMSGIASRIEAAMAALEAPRQDSSPPPQHPPPWLIPGLATAAGTLAVALLACLILLASQGGQPAESTEEIHDALAKIRRKLDEAASLAAQPQGPSETSAEASDAVHEAAQAVSRLGGAAKEAEHQLRTSIDAAESRLHAAAGMAGEFEHWIEAMPSRLAEAVSVMQASGLGGLEEAIGKLADCAARVDLAGEKLPGIVSGIAAMDEARLQMAESADAMAGGRAAMEQAAASLPGALAAAVATTAALADQVMRGVSDELANTADLAAEMTNLAFGHVVRLEDVVARAATAADGLAVLADAAPGLAETLGAAADGLRSHMAESAHTMVAGRAALTSAAEAAQAAHTALGGEVAQLGDMLTHTKTLPAQIATLVGAASAERADSSRSLENLVTLQDSVGALAREACATAEHANAVLARIATAETAPLPAPSEPAQPAPNEMHALLTVHAERLANLLDSGALVAARLEAASSSIAQQEAASALAAPLPELSVGLPEPDERLAGLEAAILRVQDAATRLQEGAAAHEAATARIGQVAATVAALAEAAPPASARPAEVTLTRLAGMATETGQLQDVAEHLAQAALRGEVPALSAELVSQTPVLLAAIETSIYRLRGTATALALASDAQRKAA